jgi:LysR family transcriptional regulator, transcriptional activator of nhaA
MNTQLNYHHLRYFLAVATNEGITPASAALKVSAPTLSAQVKELENFFGKPLFRREGRRMRPTETGRLLMRYAERIFATGDEMVEVLRGGKLAEPGTVFLGVSDAVPKLLVARLLDRASRSAPDLHCVVREGLPQELWSALASHQIDLVMATEAPPPNHPRLPPGARIGRMRVVFAAAAGIGKRFGTKGSFGDMPILAPARESVLRRELEQWWAARGIAPRIRAEFDDAAAMFELAARGLGAAPVHEPVLRDVCKRYGLVELPIRCDIQDELFVVAEKRQYASEGVALLFELAKGVLKE